MAPNLVRLPQKRDSVSESIDQVEMSLLLEGLFRVFGYDFRQYSPTSIRRRLSEIMAAEKLSTISAVQDRVLHDPEMLNRLVSSLSVQVSEFFRNPEFFLAFRQKAIPLLRTYPLIRVWHAGCASGEEVYSMAILLEEEGLLQKSLLYATDINGRALQVALHGIYSLQHVETCEKNYTKAGGTKAIWNYFTVDGGKARVNAGLRDHIVFTQHNLVTDSSFNEFNVILCRNVLIYFTKELRNRVHALLYGSLTRFGILGLGADETMQFSAFENHYRPLDDESSLYRRVN